jgi:hypothetical protein
MGRERKTCRTFYGTVSMSVSATEVITVKAFTSIRIHAKHFNKATAADLIAKSLPTFCLGMPSLQQGLYDIPDGLPMLKDSVCHTIRSSVSLGFQTVAGARESEPRKHIGNSSEPEATCKHIQSYTSASKFEHK